jgi:hypothetical protein
MPEMPDGNTAVWYTGGVMWPFRKKKKLNKTKLVVGLVIGGAIAATVGKKIMDKHAELREEQDDEGNSGL